jgi:hypothetical protein
MLFRARMPSQIPPRKRASFATWPLISGKEFQKWDTGTQSRDELVWEQEFRSCRIGDRPSLSEIAEDNLTLGRFFLEEWTGLGTHLQGDRSSSTKGTLYGNDKNPSH